MSFTKIEQQLAADNKNPPLSPREKFELRHSSQDTNKRLASLTTALPLALSLYSPENPRASGVVGSLIGSTLSLMTNAYYWYKGDDSWQTYINMTVNGAILIGSIAFIADDAALNVFLEDPSTLFSFLEYANQLVYAGVVGCISVNAAVNGLSPDVQMPNLESEKLCETEETESVVSNTP